MKKILSIILAAILSACFAACAGDTEKQEYSSNGGSVTSDYSSRQIKGFDGKVSKKWDTVSKDYEKLEDEAEKELEAGSVTRQDIETLVKEIEDGTEKLKDGITDETEDTARKVYKDAHKLKLISKRAKGEAAEGIGSLADSAKALVKQYYGEAEEDYDTVKGAVRTGIAKVREFTDDIWNALMDLLK